MERKKRPAFSAFVFLTGFFMVLLACVCFFFILKQSTDKETQTRLSNIADQTVRNIQQRLDDVFVSMKDAGAVLLKLPSTQDLQAAELLRVLARNHNASSMAVANLEGRAVASNGKSYDVSRQSYFLHAVKGGWAVSEVLTSLIDGEDSIVFSIPLYDGNAVSGVLMCTYRQEQLRTLFALDDKKNGVSASVIQVDGKMVLPCSNESSYVYYSNVLSQADIRGNMTAQELYTRLAANQSGGFAYRMDGEDYRVSFAPVGKYGWYLISTAHTGTLEGTWERSPALPLCIAAAVGLLLLAFYFAGSLPARRGRRQKESLKALTSEASCGSSCKARNKIPYGLPAAQKLAGRAEPEKTTRPLVSKESDKKQGQQDKSLMEQQLRVLLEKTNGAAFCWDRRTDTISFHGGKLKDMEKPLQTQSFSREFQSHMVDPADRSAFSALFSAAVHQRVKGESVIRIRVAHGKPVPCRFCICSILEENNTPVQISGILFLMDAGKAPALQTDLHQGLLTPIYNKSNLIAKVNDCLKLGGEHTLLLFVLDNLKTARRRLEQDVDQALLSILNEKFQDIPTSCLLGQVDRNKFVIFFPHTTDSAASQEKTQLEHSPFFRFCVGGTGPIELLGRIGSAVSPRDGETFETLYSHASSAARHSRRHGGGESFYLYPSA